MIDMIFEAIQCFGRLFRSRRQLVLENLALRHQLWISENLMADRNR
jgi:hypothetical protein